MDRRQLIKGLAALPLARLSYAMAPGCTNSKQCTPMDGSFLVWLEGPFAIAIRQDGSGITAFSPIDADHFIMFNDLAKSGAFPQQYHFNLQGVVNSQSICISPDFNDLCADHLGQTAGNIENAFVRINLPRPTNVYTSKRLNGTLGIGANVRPACVPQDHILEYQTNANTPIVTYEDNSNTQVNTSANFFHVEVGLLNKGSDPMGDHAKHFHNKSILPYFQSLSPDVWQLTDIQETLCSLTLPPQIRARLKGIRDQRKKRTSSNKKAGKEEATTTTTFECKTGGIIGTSP